MVTLTTSSSGWDNKDLEKHSTSLDTHTPSFDLCTAVFWFSLLPVVFPYRAQFFITAQVSVGVLSFHKAAHTGGGTGTDTGPDQLSHRGRQQIHRSGRRPCSFTGKIPHGHRLSIWKVETSLLSSMCHNWFFFITAKTCQYWLTPVLCKVL